MKKNKMIGYKIIKTIVGPFFRIYYNPKIIGANNIPKEGAIIVAGNHRHTLDQHNVSLATKRPIRYLAKKEYFDGQASILGKTNKITIAITKWFVNAVGCIRVDRDIKDTEATDKAVEVLNNKEAIGIFPEGTRNTTEDLLLPFKFGTVSLAAKTDAYIVPFAQTGDFKFRSKNLIIRFGEPFKVNNMNLEEANKKLQDIIELLMLENLKEEDSN